MNVRQMVPVTDGVRALLTEATINMAPYNTSAAQLACINDAIGKLQQLASVLAADVAVSKAAGN